MRTTTILAALLALAAGSAQADTIGLHLYTKHGGTDALNDHTPGLYYAHDESGTVVGAYCNSWSGRDRRGRVKPAATSSTAGNVTMAVVQSSTGETSDCNVNIYAGHEWRWPVAQGVDVKLSAVLVHGYNEHMKSIKIGGARILPAAIPSVGIGPVRLMLVGPRNLHFTLEHTWN